MDNHIVIKLEQVVKCDVYEALSHIAKYLGYDTPEAYLDAKVGFLIAGASYYAEYANKNQQDNVNK